MSGFRYCDADEAARLNAPDPTPETPSLTLSGAQRRTIAGGIHFALGVLARMGTTKDFRLANAIRSARVELTSAHAIISPHSSSASTPRVISRADAAAEPDGVPPSASGELSSHSGGGGEGKPGREGAR